MPLLGVERGHALHSPAHVAGESWLPAPSGIAWLGQLPQGSRTWTTPKQPFTPAARDAAAPGLSSKVPVRGDRAAKQKAAELKQRDLEELRDVQ